MMNRNKRHHTADEENDSPQKKSKTALYLDDYTPIRTIEVTNIKENVTAEYLRGYFDFAAGPVTDVYFVHKIEKNELIRVGYVTFLTPESAASLICDPKITFYVNFVIKIAGRAYQPTIDPNVLKFEEINDDCLLRIASYLNLIDIVNLGKTSTRLRSVTVQIYRNRKHFSFGADTGDSSTNESNMPTILKEIGIFIESIEWHRLNLIHLSYLREYCHSVTEVKLINPSKTLQSPDVKVFKGFFKYVKTLSICDARFFDATLKTMTSSSSLIALTLDNCSNVRGKFLSKWKKNKLEVLQITNSSNFDCVAVSDFVRTNKLSKFAFDRGCSFKQCLTASTEVLSHFTHIELDFSYLTDSLLALLNFEDLKQLTCLTVTNKYVRVAGNYNHLLIAVSRIQTLQSLSIEQIIIDADTVKLLGSFASLQKVRLTKVVNTIGRQLYSSIQTHLPKIIELSVQTIDTEPFYKTICDMISSMDDLKFFSHSSITWQLLNMILRIQLLRKQPRIQIEVPKVIFYDPKKKDFAATSKGAVILSCS